jgi:hypothetical protein
MRLTALRPILLVASLAALSGCGQMAELKPREGHHLPVAPYGRADQPNANELLGYTSQNRPNRAVELYTRSQPRSDDPFDLPPQEEVGKK